MLQLERSAPTPTNEGFTLVMQAMASLGYDAVSADIKNALGQSMPTNRKQPICSSLPHGMIESGFAEFSRCPARGRCHRKQQEEVPQ